MPFTRRPENYPVYTAFSRALHAADQVDERRIQREFDRTGWPLATLRKAWDSGEHFAVVREGMMFLPTVIYFGGKEIHPDSAPGKVIREFMRYFGVACALLDVSGVAGAGDGAMALGQEGHAMGKERVRRARAGLQRLFLKSGVAGVQLAIREEAPNPYVTEGWLVRPTRTLHIRKGRLFSLGIPLLTVWFEGGDATLDEFTYWKTLTKGNLRSQLDTPFSHVVPRGLFVDPDEPESYWDGFLSWYRKAMNCGEEERRFRKQSECQRLAEGLVKVGDPMAATKVGIKLLDEVAAGIYGASLVATWEERNQRDFWALVEKLSHVSF